MRYVLAYGCAWKGGEGRVCVWFEGHLGGFIFAYVHARF